MSNGHAKARRRYFFFRFTNIAVTLFAASMVTVQVGSAPPQAPPQPTNADLPEAVAVNVIVVGCVKPKEQLLRQLCPVSLTTTVPRFFFDTTMPSVTVCPVEGGVAGFSGVTGGTGVGVGVGVGVGGVGVGVGSGLGVGVGVAGVGTGASTVTFTTCAARSPLVAPVMPVPIWNVPASCDDGTCTTSVVEPCPPDASVTALLPSDSDQPEGTAAPSPNVSASQLAEFVLPAASVNSMAAPAVTVTLVADTPMLGVPGVQGGGAGFETMTLAAASDARLLAALFADASTTYEPGSAEPGTAMLSVTRASWPGSSEIELPPKASDHPVGTVAPRLNVSAPHAAELLFFTVTESCIAPPCSSVTSGGDRLTTPARRECRPPRAAS